MRHLRLLTLPVVIAVVLVAAGCGGGGSKGNSVPSDAIATVGQASVTKAAFNELIAGAKRNYKARKTAFPKVGTTQYKALQDQAVQYLVQESQLQQKADALGVKVTTKDVDDRLTQLKKQYFGGKQAAYVAQLKAQGLTEPQLKKDLYAQILSEKLYAKVTDPLKVSNAEITAYYDAHKSDYTTKESRDVRHILVNSKSLANQLETQLKQGADFATLAKKYSKDPGSAKLGGKLTISRGQTVAPFDKVAFSLKTGATSPPVHTQYGWHIIQAVSDIKPAKQTPLASVKDSISQTLLQTKKSNTMTKWVADLKKQYPVSYQDGYQPATTSTATATTTTG